MKRKLPEKFFEQNQRAKTRKWKFFNLNQALWGAGNREFRVRGGQPFLALIAAFLPARCPITRQLVMLAPSESTKCASITARSHVFAHLSSAMLKYGKVGSARRPPISTKLEIKSTSRAKAPNQKLSGRQTYVRRTTHCVGEPAGVD